MNLQNLGSGFEFHELNPKDKMSVIDRYRVASDLQAQTPVLTKDHPAYTRFRNMTPFEREELIRKLIPKALGEIHNHSTTL
jgi:hypothetical protein